jgi:P-type E1-E2 ATPase
VPPDALAAPLALTAILVPFRTSFPNTDAALALLLVVVAVAANGYRLAGYLVYFALTAAVITFLITHNIRSTIAVIIVAGACGIAAGTPLAVLGAIGRAAHQGAIVKGGLYLEMLSEADTVVLDKTGTLTYGTPELLEVCPALGISTALLLRTAAIAESRSEHPIARAIASRVIAVVSSIGVIPARVILGLRIHRRTRIACRA